ncbi:sterol desaturase family protein [Altererythrobacter sp. GH1-8]|uniref:sterol desaturase family protein n=1 Tax=Altererythrobacter sp. GH1-8 TaxID=3349333 RepID=UPI00374DED4E
MTLGVVGMIAVIAARYLASSGLFSLLTRVTRPGLYRGMEKQIRREIGWSLASAAIYGLPAGILAWGWHNHGWTRVYTSVSDFPLWYLPLSLLIYLFAHDTWFYWTHRLLHDPKWFRRAHAVHHSSKPPTAWAAMNFHPIEAVSGAVVIPALVLLVPIHVSMLMSVLSIMTIMGVTNHMGWELFPRALVHSRFGQWVITASHHEKHHEEYTCNYGLYFRIWDRLCGTDRGLSTKLAQRSAI